MRSLRRATARAEASRLAEKVLEGGDGLHLDQELLLYEAIDDQQGVRRVGAAREKLREFTQAPGHELRDVLRVHEVSGELDDVRKSGAGRFQRFGDLREDAAALGVEIGTGRQHAGDKKKFVRLYPRQVRVLAERLAERVDVRDLDVGHQLLRLRSWRHCTSPRPACWLRRRPATNRRSDSRLR